MREHRLGTRTRHHRGVLPALALACALWAILGTANAQPAPREPIDVERFKPAVTYDGWVTLEGSDVRPEADRWAFGAFLNYAVNPLVVIDQNDDLVARFVSGRLGGDVLASVTIIEPFAVGLDIPFFLIQTGDEDPDFGGLGDIRLVPKFRILDDRELFGLAVATELRVPTHVGDFSGGARNVVFLPTLIADHRFGFGLRVGTNVGVMLREGTVFENVEAASEFTYGAAVGYRIGGWEKGIVELGTEFHGGAGFTATDYEELPLEGALYGKVFPTKEWEVVFGPSVGIIPGYGIPTFRAFAGVRYTPTQNDRDGDGIPDVDDQCPDEPEDRDNVEDSDGCPEEEPVDGDDDVDGVPNSQDQCPGQKETINGIQDEDGCPDGGPAQVIRQSGKLVILKNVEFATASALIQPTSYSILNQVALVMKANPDITLLRVEGHTDSRGPREMNLWLSKARAQSVRKYLIMKGVKAERLEAEGYGPDRPLVPETDDAAMQKNRRVEFVVVKQGG